MSIRVRNWEKFQHSDTFKKSGGIPPWIKLYQSILENHEIESLSDTEFGVLVRIWLWAARLGNDLPSDQAWWRRRFGSNIGRIVDRLIELELLEGDPIAATRRPRTATASPQLRHATATISQTVAKPRQDPTTKALQIVANGSEDPTHREEKTREEKNEPALRGNAEGWSGLEKTLERDNVTDLLDRLAQSG